MTNITKICDFIGDYIIHNYNYNNQMSFKVGIFSMYLFKYIICILLYIIYMLGIIIVNRDLNGYSHTLAHVDIYFICTI